MKKSLSDKPNHPEKRAVLIVWEAVLISVFVIEEYRNKTIAQLFTYPVSRTKLIMAKLFLICGISFSFHVLSNIFQYASIFFAAIRRKGVIT